jgi:hypothetical protein
MSQNLRLYEDLMNAYIRRDLFEYGSENWLFFDRNCKALEEEASKREVDERYAVRTWE